MTAIELAAQLRAAERFRVRDWPAFGHTIPAVPGAYRFTDPGGVQIYVGETTRKGGLRQRLRDQVKAQRFGRVWRPPRSVCAGANLLNNVLKDRRDGRPLVKPFGSIDPQDPHTVRLLEEAFQAIDGLYVQWVECPADMTERVEHMACRWRVVGRTGGAS